MFACIYNQTTEVPKLNQTSTIVLLNLKKKREKRDLYLGGTDQQCGPVSRDRSESTYVSFQRERRNKASLNLYHASCEL